MVDPQPLVIDLDAPSSWLPAISAAVLGWPAGVQLRHERAGESSGNPFTVRAVAATVDPAAAAGVRPDEHHAQALVVGRGAMHTDRFTSWAQRTLTGAVGADHQSLTGWAGTDTQQSFELPSDARSSHEARKVVRSLAERLSCLDDVVLATSELTANALQHGGGARSLSTSQSPTSFVVGVTDDRPDALPSVLSLRGAAASGRGMAIIDAISDHWGITVFHDRKLVWCEFAVRPRGE